MTRQEDLLQKIAELVNEFRQSKGLTSVNVGAETRLLDGSGIDPSTWRHWLWSWNPSADVTLLPVDLSSSALLVNWQSYLRRTNDPTSTECLSPPVL